MSVEADLDLAVPVKCNALKNLDPAEALEIFQKAIHLWE